MSEEKDVTEEIDRFSALGNDGLTYTVVISQKFRLVRTQTTVGNPPRTPLGGTKTAKTSTGMSLTRIDDNTFRIDKTGVIIRRQQGHDPR